MKTCTFVREYGGWYIDLPEYLQQGGSKGDLALVAGADTLLDLLAEGRDRVTIDMGTQPFAGADELLLLRPSPAGGGDYLIGRFEGREIQQELWLCDVTLFVFGDLPERIYIRKVGG